MQPYQYFDAAAYFQAKLDAICAAMEIESYSVSNERKLDAVNARVIVVSAMAGDVGTISANITYEISAYTNNPEEVLAVLTQLAKTETGKTFVSESEDPDGNVTIYNVVGSYMSPTIMERDLEIGPNHGVRVVQYVRFGILTDLLDVKSVAYKGETVEFAQATVNYVAELNSNNKSGQSLMKSTASGAAFSFSLTMAPQKTALAQDVMGVVLGSKDKNASFSLTITLGDTNPITFTGAFIVSGATFNSVRGAIPSLQVSFSQYDA